MDKSEAILSIGVARGRTYTPEGAPLNIADGLIKIADAILTLARSVDYFADVVKGEE